MGERDERLDAQVELDEISRRAEARVANQRLDLKPAPLDELPISTLSGQTENPAGATTSAPRARAQTPSDASSRQIAQRPSVVVPDVVRLENLAPTSNPPAAPTIRVTIGRIEVRAVMPPAMPAKERTRTAPKLSLDEYLRSQNGGNKR
jgi:phage tail sheath protein FI